MLRLRARSRSARPTRSPSPTARLAPATSTDAERTRRAALPAARPTRRVRCQAARRSASSRRSFSNYRRRACRACRTRERTRPAIFDGPPLKPLNFTALLAPGSTRCGAARHRGLFPPTTIFAGIRGFGANRSISIRQSTIRPPKPRLRESESMAASAQEKAEPRDTPTRPFPASLAFGLIAFMMAAYAAGYAWSTPSADTADELLRAYEIRHGNAYPLEGPFLGNALHLGPMWW